ncbi:MAG: hypothetical protein IKT42_01650 [Clostridia bacterium]|nr:hypothetical protein [Clostridia bacterium]
MNNDLFEKAFDAIDDELIADAKNPSIRIAARRKKILISSIAACVAAVLVSIQSINVLSDLNSNNYTTSDDTEIIYEEEIVYEQTTSEDDTSIAPDKHQNINSDATTPITYNKLTIDDMPFADSNSANLSAGNSTKSYDEIYVPDIKYLYIEPIPADGYITLYHNKSTYDNPPSEEDARTYLDIFLPKLANAFQITTPQYNLEQNSYMAIGEYSTYIILHDKNDYSMFFNHRELYNEIKLSHNNVTFKEDLMIDGQLVTVDHTKTDEEIIKSLSWIKERLFDIFDVSFDNAKIIRKYGDTYGDVYVYFYNRNGGTLDKILNQQPSTDYIKIRFSGNMIDNSILNGSDVNCKISRATHTAVIEGNTFKLMPLEKAEEYLYKGYVFGGPGCPLCLENQTPVDFEGYDYVGISYSYSSKIRSSFPCYTFYKNIGTSENGNMTFAKTYVPAVEVEGYEEYFINKHNNHNTNTSNNNDDYILEDNGE